MWYAIVITVLTGYFLGNLNGAVNMSTLLAHEDVRTHGSGNAGLTNFARSYGGVGTALVLLVDCGKTVLAGLAGGLLLKPYGMAAEGRVLGALAASLGHDFPLLLGFKGGKGIVCGLAAGFLIDWRVGVALIAVFSLLYFPTGYVSLGSVAGAVTLIAGSWILYYDQPLIAAGGTLIGLLAILMHRKNIVRLLRGEEKKTNLFKGRHRE